MKLPAEIAVWPAAWRELWAGLNVGRVRRRRGFCEEHDTAEAEEAGMMVGDVVRLRSGGPRMTIAGVGASEGPPMTQREECVMCMWFDGQQDKWAVFPVRSLDLLAPADSDG